MLWTKFGSNFTFKFYIQNLLLQQFLWVYENYWYLWFIFLVFQKIKSQKTIPQEETPPKNKRLVLVLFKNRLLLYKKKTKKLDIITASSFFSVKNYLRIWLISNWYVIYYIGQSRQFYRGWWWHEQQWEWGWFLHHNQHCVHHTTQVLTAACSNREISWFKALSVLLLKTFHDMAFTQSIFNVTFAIVFVCDNTMNQNYYI